MSRFCIIGCGLTGAVTASLIKQKLPQVQVTILEKSKGTGGRFGTSRSSFGSPVDLGAQYVTMTEQISEIQKKCYAELIETDLLKPLQAEVEGLKTNLRVKNFYCPQGSGSIVKHFLKASGCEVLFGQRVTKLNAKEGKWNLLCENNSSFEFDAVISTVPVPQILQIEGILLHLQGKELENLKTVHYSSRFALGLFYDNPSSYFDNIPYVSKYVSNDGILRFLSFDHKKRSSSDLPSIVLHTTKEYGRKHVEEESTLVGKEILRKFKEIIPDLPEPSDIKYHKWRYSQVEESYPGKPGCIIIARNPLLLGGGDGFSSSTFEGCVYSSEKILDCIIENR